MSLAISLDDTQQDLSSESISMVASDVDEILLGSRMQSMSPATARREMGRNKNWTAATADGDTIFVKMIDPSHIDREDRFKRIQTFERIRSRSDVLDRQTPRLYGTNRDTGISVYQGISDAVKIGDDPFSTLGPDMIKQLAVLMAHLHASAPEAGNDPTTSEPFHLPDLRIMNAIPWRMYHRLTEGERRAWALIQSDSGLTDGIERLLALEASTDPVPVHGDFRFDQLLEQDGVLFLTDWEEFRYGDSARDIGAYIGQWIQWSFIESLRDHEGHAGDIQHDAIVQLAVQRLESVARERIETFWSSYRRANPSGATFDLAVRSVGFAGWHLFDRLLASANRTMRLSGVDRAIAGMGRKVLMRPEGFADALGLIEE